MWLLLSDVINVGQPDTLRVTARRAVDELNNLTGLLKIADLRLRRPPRGRGRRETVTKLLYPPLRGGSKLLTDH